LNFNLYEAVRSTIRREASISFDANILFGWWGSLSTLHDIGKITIEKKILSKSGELTAKEWEAIKKHPENGYKIASSSEEFAPVAEEIYTHHESWDGTGYPRSLKGKEIPYLARIISIIDAYDVMTNDRPYTKAIPQKEAKKYVG
jgi:HD-GYP domain-containing protein (c-di-GMP phosphodiesterase class II)